MWQLMAARYGFQAGMLAGHAAEALIKSRFRGSKSKYVRALAPPVGFAAGQIGISELLRPYEEKPEWQEYDDWEDWSEPVRVQGFNPHTWGRNRERTGGSVYGMGSR